MSGPKKKNRADELVHQGGIAESRNKAQALILAGKIRWRLNETSEWATVEKAGQLLDASATVELVGPKDPYVGRGAYKLKKAFEVWPQLDATGKSCVDIGSSTGGFTQVLLEKGASRVLALDVGRHQLHEKLRSDARVISAEGQHVLRIEASFWGEVGIAPPFDMVVADLSFISLTKILPVAAEWMRPGADGVFLVKPQFELGPKKAQGGIVRKPEHHAEAIELVKAAAKATEKLEWQSIEPSPILGGDGNKEFLAWVRRRND